MSESQVLCSAASRPCRSPTLPHSMRQASLSLQQCQRQASTSRTMSTATLRATVGAETGRLTQCFRSPHADTTGCGGHSGHSGQRGTRGSPRLGQTLMQHWNSSCASVNTSTSRKSRSRWSTERRPWRSGAAGEQWPSACPSYHRALTSPNITLVSFHLYSRGLRLQLWRSRKPGAGDGAPSALLLWSLWSGGSRTVLAICKGAGDGSSCLCSLWGVPRDRARRTT